MGDMEKTFERIAEMSRQSLEKAKNFEKRRFLFSEIMRIVQAKKHLIVLLTGMRGAGKTVLSLQVGNNLLREGEEVLYIPADHVALSDISLYDIVKHSTMHGYTYFIVDEIHSRPDWSKELKSIYDSLDVFVLATGSSTALLRKGRYDLSRRALEIKLPVMSYREMVNLRFDKNRTVLSLEEILRGFRNLSIKYKPYSIMDYLSYYSLPVSLECTPDIGKELILSTIEKVIYKDLPDLYHLDAETIYDAKKLLVYLSSITPGETSISNLTQMLENVGKGTVKTLLTAFSELGVTFAVPPHGKPGKRLRKSYKVLMTPPYRHIIARARGLEPSIGTLREDFFVAHACHAHSVEYFKSKRMPDYVLDGRYIFEIGGSKKTKRQIKAIKEAYLVADTTYSETKIPLHLFGYLY